MQKEVSMKTMFPMIVFALSSVSALASTAPLWDCGDGISVEGLSVYVSQGELKGSLSWDCFPGDGICNQRANLKRIVLNNGDQIFEGPYFELIIHTSVAPGAEGYKAHMIAKDMTDASDMGRGFTFNQFVTCQEHE